MTLHGLHGLHGLHRLKAQTKKTKFLNAVEFIATGQALQQILKHLEGGHYRKYKGIQGNYGFSDFLLRVDYGQGDPVDPPTDPPGRINM